MENKINIAEILKDCPKGTKLYSPLVGECTLEHIHGELKKILISTSDGTTLTFNYNGTYFQMDNSECLLFPSKDQRDWSKFQRPFKDGDIVATESGNWIGITTGGTYNESIPTYCIIDPNDTLRLYFDKPKSWSFNRLATEEEKEKLFQAIKANGYKWNLETKTLEKLVESNEDVDDKIVMSGIYFDRENYADEVELHLGNYEIEVRNGKTYAVFKNQETKISKPIFKVGDKIKHKDTVLTIINVKTNSYIVEDEPYNFGILMFSQQDKWELINEPKFKVGDRVKKNKDYISGIVTDIFDDSFKVTYKGGSCSYVQFHYQHEWELVSNKFDINTLKPFESRVLVRNHNYNYWRISFFGFFDKNKCVYDTIRGIYSQCIPYEGNEHLCGTTNDCDEYYKTW